MATKKKKAVKKKAPAKKAKKAKTKTKRKPNPAFMKPMKPSAALAEVVGAKPLPRTEVIKGLWKYIKKHNLQDKKNRRAINADATLMPLFKKGQVTMFELAKIANKNLS
jgi:chromatin remodeling complex protein RSC6